MDIISLKSLGQKKKIHDAIFLSKNELIQLLNLRDYIDLTSCQPKAGMNEEHFELINAIDASFPLNEMCIYEDGVIVNVNKIKLMCVRYKLPFHSENYGDPFHFSLKINDSISDYHLYPDGTLTGRFGIRHSFPANSIII